MARSVYVPSGAEVVAYASVECEDQFDFRMLMEDLVCSLEGAFPSVSKDKGYEGREGAVVASNRLVKFVVAEYCGLLSVSIVPKDDEYYGLGKGFANKVEAKFKKVVAGVFGGIYNRVGAFSNGECIYQKAAA